MTALLQEETVNTVNLVNRVVVSTSKKHVKQDPLADFFGMWADREVDAETLRKQAWGIEV